MKKNILLIILFSIILNPHSIYSQSQFGIQLSPSLNIISSDDIKADNQIGFSFSLVSNIFISKKTDLSFELGYGLNKLEIDSYKNFNEQMDTGNKYSLNQFFLNILYEYYIIVPDKNKLFFSVLGGFGSTLSTEVLEEENGFYDDLEIEESIKKFNPYYTLGVSTGTEKLRIGLRYNRYIGNYFSNTSVYGTPNELNLSKSRSIEGKNSNISINLTYYFTNTSY